MDSSAAADDLEAIANFIAVDSEHYASLFAIDVLSAVDRLTDFPYSGRSVPELNDPAIREILFGSYRIVYRVKSDMVELLTVYHGSQLLDHSRLTLYD
ncbi:MAG: type II toxin-antitoxin system RelE/ParE family toxin [Chlorobium sp.]|nr:MAG: type II toxin-antitoxin system RelE/ParE family toxin [Chlorobium sp.]